VLIENHEEANIKKIQLVLRNTLDAWDSDKAIIFVTLVRNWTYQEKNKLRGQAGPFARQKEATFPMCISFPRRGIAVRTKKKKKKKFYRGDSAFHGEEGSDSFILLGQGVRIKEWKNPGRRGNISPSTLFPVSGGRRKWEREN